MANDLTDQFDEVNVADLRSLAGQLNSIAKVANVHNGTEIPSKLPKSPSATGQIRSLDSEFVISDDGPSLALYTVSLSVTAPLLSVSSASVTLVVDGEVRGQALLESQQTLGLSLVGLQTVQRQQLNSWVEPSSTVLLTSSTTGTASVSLVSSIELVFV